MLNKTVKERTDGVIAVDRDDQLPSILNLLGPPTHVRENRYAEKYTFAQGRSKAVNHQYLYCRQVIGI